MQKAASKERKTILKEQRNLIKSQLSANNLVTKLKRNVQKQERRQSGPLKVYNIKAQQSHTITSETSISKQSSATEEIISVTSRSSVAISSDTGPPSELDEAKEQQGDDERNLSIITKNSEHVKK